MVKKWMTWINYGVSGAIGILLFAALCLLWMRPTEFPSYDTTARKSTIPKGSFARAAQDYQSIAAPALDLAFSPLSVQLPDLRRYLVYYGKNGRPDAHEENPVLYLSFTGNKTPSPVHPGQRLYIMYDKGQTPHQYVFSPNNDQTPLWIEASVQGNQAVVKVGMKGENEQIVNEPKAYANFNLPEKEFVRFGGTVWELGKWRVDGTILARQKARWYGVDKFLEKHGGDEYKEFHNKQRIDFGEGDDAYSVYIGQGDCLIWTDSKWQAVKAGDASLKRTMMCAKKIDERVMNLELWDVDGKGKIVLNLIKANEAWMPQNLEQNFKFVGARTRSQFVFEINEERMLLRPHDWLVLTDAGWEKIETSESIDNYVERKTVGPMFVFDHIERKEDRQVIMGTLFNAARTEMVPIELTLQQGTTAMAKAAAGEKKQKLRESNMSSVVKTRGKQGTAAEGKIPSNFIGKESSTAPRD